MAKMAGCQRLKSVWDRAKTERAQVTSAVVAAKGADLCHWPQQRLWRNLEGRAGHWHERVGPSPWQTWAMTSNQQLPEGCKRGSPSELRRVCCIGLSGIAHAAAGCATGLEHLARFILDASTYRTRTTEVVFPGR